VYDYNAPKPEHSKFLTAFILNLTLCEFSTVSLRDSYLEPKRCTLQGMFYKALSILSPKTATVAENGDCRRFLRQIVAEIGEYSRQCGQALRGQGEIYTERIQTRTHSGVWSTVIYTSIKQFCRTPVSFKNLQSFKRTHKTADLTNFFRMFSCHSFKGIC